MNILKINNGKVELRKDRGSLIRTIGNGDAVNADINNNGSLKIEGDFEIVDKAGNVYDLGGREIVGICRCGLSKNKPFCDGSHNGNFDHEAIAFALPPKK